MNKKTVNKMEFLLFYFKQKTLIHCEWQTEKSRRLAILTSDVSNKLCGRWSVCLLFTNIEFKTKTIFNLVVLTGYDRFESIFFMKLFLFAIFTKCIIFILHFEFAIAVLINGLSKNAAIKDLEEWNSTAIQHVVWH